MQELETEAEAFGGVIALSGRDHTLRRWLVGTVIFNLFDLVLTIGVVLTGLALEANPLLAELLESSPLAFGLTKLSLVSAGVFLIWRHREKPLAYVAGGLCFGAYAVVIGIHMQGMVLASLGS